MCSYSRSARVISYCRACKVLLGIAVKCVLDLVPSVIRIILIFIFGLINKHASCPHTCTALTLPMHEVRLQASTLSVACVRVQAHRCTICTREHTTVLHTRHDALVHKTVLFGGSHGLPGSSYSYAHEQTNTSLTRPAEGRDQC